MFLNNDLEIFNDLADVMDLLYYGAKEGIIYRIQETKHTIDNIDTENE
jgi:hypothetical protein